MKFTLEAPFFTIAPFLFDTLLFHLYSKQWQIRLLMSEIYYDAMAAGSSLALVVLHRRFEPTTFTRSFLSLDLKTCSELSREADPFRKQSRIIVSPDGFGHLAAVACHLRSELGVLMLSNGTESLCWGLNSPRFGPSFEVTKGEWRARVPAGPCTWKRPLGRE